MRSAAASRPPRPLAEAGAGRRRRSAARRTAGDALRLLLGTDGGDRAIRRDDHVRHPPFDPQASEAVEVADVARSMPAGPRRRVQDVVGLSQCGTVGEPEPVVVIFQVSGRDHDLAEDPRFRARCAGRAPLRVECAHQHAGGADRRPHAHTRVGGIGGVSQTVEGDVGHQQALRHSVGRVRCGVRHEPRRRLEQRPADGCTGGQGEPGRG